MFVFFGFDQSLPEKLPPIVGIFCWSKKGCAPLMNDDIEMTAATFWF
jgi:hypothetical protein